MVQPPRITKKEQRSSVLFQGFVPGPAESTKMCTDLPEDEPNVQFVHLWCTRVSQGPFGTWFC